MRFGIPQRIVAAAVLLTLALVGMVVREGMARDRGREVLLVIDAHDPRSLLTGHYVQFQMQETLTAGTTCPPGIRGPDRTPRWIALAPNGGHHSVAGAAASRAQALALGGIAVRGRVNCYEGREPVAPGRGEVSPGTRRPRVDLDLGIRRFHADQQEAEAIGKSLLGGTEAFAVVSVGDDGKARLKGLVVGGRRTDLDWF